MIRAFVTIIGLIVCFPGLGKAALCEAGEPSTDTRTAGLHEVQASHLQIQFDSGAQWELCWHIDDYAGLVLSRVFYGAPEQQPRQVLDAASLGQILFKYDEDFSAIHLLSDPGLGGEQILEPDQSHCVNGELISGIGGHQLCRRIREINHMTKVRHSESIRRHELSLHTWSRVGSHLFQQIWRLSEDGEIKPSVLFSGTINRYTDDPRFGVKLNDSSQYAASATLLYNWRLDFNINGTPANDRVDEIDFPTGIADAATRIIKIHHLTNEGMRTTSRENFRGWRISDSEYSSGTNSGAAAATRIGYYLDPQSAGYRYLSQSYHWPQFDFSLTARHSCEKLASDNGKINAGCANNLDEYINDENLYATDIVTWFSLSQHFTPRMEDVPAINGIETGFTLVPFDWSAHSPFSSTAKPQEAVTDPVDESE